MIRACIKRRNPLLAKWRAGQQPYMAPAAFHIQIHLRIRCRQALALAQLRPLDQPETAARKVIRQAQATSSSARATGRDQGAARAREAACIQPAIHRLDCAPAPSHPWRAACRESAWSCPRPGRRAGTPPMAARRSNAFARRAAYASVAASSGRNPPTHGSWASTARSSCATSSASTPRTPKRAQ